MSMNHIEIGEAYYAAMGAKDLAKLAAYIHPEIKFISPFAAVEGKTAFLTSVEGFMKVCKNLTVRTAFGEGDQAMIVYDVDSSVGPIRSAALMHFRGDLICRLELFFDARPFK